MKFVINPEVTKVVEEETYTVTLSKDEAAVIASLLGKVSKIGSTEFGRIAYAMWEDGFEKFLDNGSYKEELYSDDKVIYTIHT